MTLSRVSFVACALSLSTAIACRGERGPAGPAGPPATAPTAAEVANLLANDPAFAQAVARELATRNRVDAPSPAATNGAENGARATIAIDQNGAMTLDGHAVTQAELVAQMRGRLAADPDVRVILAADRRLTQQQTIGVIDSLRGIGVRRFSMAVAPQ